jgi:hypothetical protein
VQQIGGWAVAKDIRYSRGKHCSTCAVKSLKAGACAPCAVGDYTGHSSRVMASLNKCRLWYRGSGCHAKEPWCRLQSEA